MSTHSLRIPLTYALAQDCSRATKRLCCLMNFRRFSRRFPRTFPVLRKPLKDRLLNRHAQPKLRTPLGCSLNSPLRFLNPISPSTGRGNTDLSACPEHVQPPRHKPFLNAIDRLLRILPASRESFHLFSTSKPSCSPHHFLSFCGLKLLSDRLVGRVLPSPIDSLNNSILCM